MLRDEIEEILDLFDEYGISEIDQRSLFEKGLHFDFTYGDPDYGNPNPTLTIFGVGILLKTFKEHNMRIDIKKLLEQPYRFENEELVRAIANAQHSDTRIPRLGKR